ncbi:MAG: archease [Candidatus Zixiibacteriota bacterium]
MSYNYEYLPDVALADIAYRVRADNLADLFRGAAEGLNRVLVDAKGITALKTQPLSLVEDNVSDALHAFLSEIVYLKDAQSFLVHDVDLTVQDTPLVTVTGTFRGDTIDPSRHELGQDVKAITYHMFEAGRDERGYYAQVVLDI